MKASWTVPVIAGISLLNTAMAMSGGHHSDDDEDEDDAHHSEHSNQGKHLGQEKHGASVRQGNPGRGNQEGAQ